MLPFLRNLMVLSLRVGHVRVHVLEYHNTIIANGSAVKSCGVYLLVCLCIVQHSTQYQPRNDSDNLSDHAKIGYLLIVTL